MKDINDFKNKIKDQDELMSLDEVKGMLTDPALGFFAARWKQIGTLAIAVLGAIAALFWLLPSESNETAGNANEPIIETTIDSLSQLTIDSVLSDKETINTETDHSASKRNFTYRPATTPKLARTYLDNTASSNPMAQKDEVPTAPSPQAPKKNNGNFPKSESYYFDGWQKESQSFTINPSKSNVLRGEEGTILIIPPFAVCGNYESFESEIQLTEYYKKEDMLLAQLTTMSHGDLLESAGMIEITATANGKELKLCKDITVLFPSNKYEDNTYVGFSGTWDDAHNNVDWTQLSGQNFNFFGGSIFPDCSRSKYQAIRCNWGARKTALKNPGKSDIRKDYRNDEVIRRIRKRFWFQDSCTSDLYDQVYEGIKYKMKDTMSASAYHACRLSKAKAESLRNFLDSLRNGGQVTFDPNILDQQTGYILATVSDLGPINCDRFTNYKNKSTYTYNIGKSEGAVASRLIFRDIQSVMPGTQKGTNEVEFANIPRGERVTLLVIKHLDSSILLAHQEMSIGDEPNLLFEEVSKADITEVLKALANGKKTEKVKPIAKIANKETKVEEIDNPLVSKSIFENAIVLTKEELEKFYIFQHDDILLFSRSQKDKASLELVYREGSSSSRYSIQGTPINGMNSEYPKAVVTIQNTLYKKWSTQWNEITCDKYMPILVKFDHGVSDYSVWWFEKNEKNVAKLPERYTTTYYNYCLDPKAVTSDTTYKKGEKKYPNTTKSSLATPYSPEQAVQADKKLLKELNIHFSNEKLIYTKREGLFKRRQYRSRKISNTTYITGYLDYNEAYQKNTPPSYITMHNSSYLDITEMVSSNNQKQDMKQYFYANKHKMIAVRVGKHDKSEVVFWYENTKRLNELLSPKDKAKTFKYLKMMSSLSIPVAEAKELTRELYYDKMVRYKNLKDLSIRPIEPTKDLLMKLDIDVNGKNITYSIYPNKEMQLEITFLKDHSLSAFTPIPNDGPVGKIMPQIISDKYGKSYRLTISSPEKKADIDRLIPIYVSSTESFHLSDYFNDYFHPDCIFWYEPTDAFLALLPADMREQLKYELSLMELATPDTSVVALSDEEPQIKKQCVYLDPCSDIKTNLKEVKLYPNPTTGDVNIKISATAATSGTLSVNNLAGQEMKSIRLEDIRSGAKLDISDLPSGIYLVTLLTNDGDKITRRVIRE